MQLRAFVVVTVLTGACSSGSFVATAADGGADSGATATDAGGVTDSAAPEGGSDAPAKAFCASLAPTPTFCADFDGADWAAGWTPKGPVARTSTSYVSAPAAFDSTTTATEKEARLFHGVATVATRFLLSFDIFVAEVPNEPDTIAEILFGTYTFSYGFRTAGAYIGEYLSGSGEFASAGVPAPLPGRFTHVEIHLDVSAGAFTVAYDGIVAKSATLQKNAVSAGGATTLAIGSLNLTTSTPAPTSYTFDNVVYDVK